MNLTCSKAAAWGVMNVKDRNTSCVKAFSFLFAVMFLLLGTFQDTGAGQTPGRIILEPGRLFQGGICRVYLYPAKGFRVKSASFSGKSLVLKRTGDGSYIGIIGAGLREKTGWKKLAVNLVSDTGQSMLVTKKVIVRGKTYPEEHLKVSRKMVEFPPKILKRVLSDQKAVRKACRAITPDVYWDLPFIWPVNSKILSPFGLRRFFNGQPRSPHSGIDLRAKTGTAIKSPNNGRVVLVRDCYLSGNTVVIDHGGGLYTLYAHLSRVMAKKGKMVKKGELIGLAGATGRATGPHLHWGVSFLGERVDPEMLMELFGT